MDEATRRIATQALLLAQQDRFVEAARVIEPLSKTQAMVDVMCAWIDTMIAYVYPEHERGQPIAVRFGSFETGRVSTADEVDWTVAWAGRLVSYRAANDYEGFMSVLYSIPEGKALGDGVLALLNVVATSLLNSGAIQSWARKVDL